MTRRGSSVFCTVLALNPSPVSLSARSCTSARSTSDRRMSPSVGSRRVSARHTRGSSPAYSGRPMRSGSSRRAAPQATLGGPSAAPWSWVHGASRCSPLRACPPATPSPPPASGTSCAACSRRACCRPPLAMGSRSGPCRCSRCRGVDALRWPSAITSRRCGGVRCRLHGS